MAEKTDVHNLYDKDGGLILGGSGNAYTAVTSRDVTGYHRQLRICGKAGHSNSGAATLNVNGLGAVAIRKNASAALATGDIVSGQYYDFAYDEANGWFQILNPSVSTASLVTGPASATDSAVALFDGTSGKLLKNSSATIDSSGNLTLDGDGGVLTVKGTGNVGIELGNVDGTGSLTFLDMHTGATVVDYDVRLLASGGTGSDGGGTLNIAAATLQHNGAALFTAADQTVKPVAQGSIAAATLDIVLGSADMYEIDLINIAPATDGQEFFARFSQSGSFLSGASDYQWNIVTNGANSNDAADSEMRIADNIGNASGEFVTVSLRIYRPSAAGFVKSMIWYGRATTATPTLIETTGGGLLIANANAIDGVRFMFASGNIASGYYAARSYSFT